MNTRLINTQKGFSLIELLISIALTGIVSAAIYGAYWSQERVHKAQSMVSEMQSNAKLAMLIISKDARMINAYLGEDGMKWFDSTAGAWIEDEGKEYVKGLKAWNDLDSGSDVIDIAYADSEVSSPLKDDMPPYTDVEVDDASGFEVNDLVITTDYGKSNLMKVTNANDSSDTLTFNRGTRSSFFGTDHPDPDDPKAMISLAKFVSYRIDHSDPDHPTLEMWDDPENFDPNEHPDDRVYQPLTQDIEDLQVAYIMEDGDEVDQPDDDTDGDDTNDYDDVRAIRVSIVARTSNPVIGFSGSNRPALEDNPAGTTDDYQRRVLTETFLVRNLNL